MREKTKRRLQLARHHVAKAEHEMVDQYRRIRRLESAGVNTIWDRTRLDSFETRLLNLRARLAVLEFRSERRPPGSPRS